LSRFAPEFRIIEVKADCAEQPAHKLKQHSKV